MIQKMYIGGEFIESSDGETMEIINPADQSVYAIVPKATREDAAKALKAAKAAQKKWAKLPAQTRAGYVVKLADLLEANTEEFAKTLSMEQGKPLHEARGEVGGSVGFLRYAAESARRIEGNILTSEIENEQIWIQRVPFGVTVGLLAWNFPLALACRKLGNALVCGNSMVVKPPSETPVAVLKLGKLTKEAGIPDGVLQFITGPGRTVGDELVSNPITQLVTLTGSTGAGRQLYKAAAENITVLRLELGGKAPFIVMDDADIDKAVTAAVISRFSNCGQICTCNERMYIHEDIYDEFMDKFVSKVEELTVGFPLEEGTDIGPKVNLEEIEKLVEMVDTAKKQGGKVLTGGNRLTDGKYAKGFFFEPTVIADVKNDANIIQEEIFGPIVPVIKINSFEQAIEYANDCDYGLSAYLFTNNARNIMRMVNELEFGEVYVNRENGEMMNAFHNGFKLSGVGGEDGKYGLEGYLQKKTIYMNYND